MMEEYISEATSEDEYKSEVEEATTEEGCIEEYISGE